MVNNPVVHLPVVKFHGIHLEAKPGSLGHRVVLLELVQLQLDAVKLVVAEVVGSTTGWVGALSFS